MVPAQHERKQEHADQQSDSHDGTEIRRGGQQIAKNGRHRDDRAEKDQPARKGKCVRHSAKIKVYFSARRNGFPLVSTDTLSANLFIFLGADLPSVTLTYDLKWSSMI
jgi:hypothetical protein